MVALKNTENVAVRSFNAVQLREAPTVFPAKAA